MERVYALLFTTLLERITTICLIIVKPKDAIIPESTLRSAFAKNSDGWGMMRLSRKKNVVARKGLGNFEEFFKIYQRDFAKTECALHFRWATQGTICAEQSHPYQISKNHWIMHNGVLTEVPEWDGTKSDTWHFAEMLKGVVEAGLMRDPGIQHMLDQTATSQYSKFVTLDPKGFVIYNVSAGTVIDGCWYSNTTMWDSVGKVPAAKTTTTSTQTATPALASGHSESEYAEWWENCIRTGMANIEDAPFDMQYDLNEKFKKQTMSLGEYQATVESGPTNQELMDEENTMIPPPMPRNFVEWANLSEYEMKLLTYDSPDAVAEAFHDMLQSGGVLS